MYAYVFSNAGDFSEGNQKYRADVNTFMGITKEKECIRQNLDPRKEKYIISACDQYEKLLNNFRFFYSD